MLFYVAWIACWQAVFDPRLWTEAAGHMGSSRAPSKMKRGSC
jgi:hypothetical protein